MGDFPFSIPFRFYYFCSIKSMDSLTLKCHNSFQNSNKRNATHSFAPRPLIFKLQKKVLKFNDICVSWSSQKTDVRTNFLTSKFEVWECQFFSSFSQFFSQCLTYRILLYVTILCSLPPPVRKYLSRFLSVKSSENEIIYKLNRI